MAVSTSSRARQTGTPLFVAILTILLLMAQFFLPFGSNPAFAATRYLDEVFTSVTLSSNVQYGSALDYNGQPVTLRLDVRRPSGDSVTNRPAVIWAHGGYLKSGDKTDSIETEIVTKFTKRGFVTASINYRLRPYMSGLEDPDYPLALRDAKHDMLAAIRYFRANATSLGIDPNKITVGGFSAGAGMSNASATNWEDSGSSGNPGYSSKPQAALSRAGALFADWPHYNSGDSPVAMFHGTSDAVVPYAAATDTCNAINAVGVACEMTTYQGGNHTLSSYSEDIAERSSDFMCRRVPINCGSPPPPPPSSPTIGLNKTSVTFTGQSYGANLANQSVIITNTGGGTLSWSATDPVAALTYTPTSGNLAASASQTMTISFAPGSQNYPPGTYGPTYITITAPGATNTPRTIAVYITLT